MKGFSEVRKGDKVYLISITNSELPVENLIKEFEIENVECVENTLHYKVILNNGTVICPTGLFPYHSVIKETTGKQYEIVKALNEDIYATSKEECIRIAKNSVDLTSRKMENVMLAYKTQIDKLKTCSSILEELKNNVPVEVKAEVVVV